MGEAQQSLATQTNRDKKIGGLRESGQILGTILDVV